ncbi:ABC transporter permease subunit [Cellulophaga baltica]|uniref:ABC transporter permease n=1 Tax=Cellulophaga TaxID=104264 RepID=UPI001C074047|nr:MULTISPECIES: ABC transporter permease subunit [Cellulophaga]MBU2997610.1 ABC transporter permease subunit [Cellulophaga baltica]MDO6769005.1 ABC transporter permease subunit [Cellulophaga sp. 1_MG-2023]
MKNILTPFEKINKNTKLFISLGWVFVVVLTWYLSSMGERHLFPSPQQVFQGLAELYNEGLVVHIGSSLLLCFSAIIIAIIISLIFSYLSTIPLVQPVAKALSKLRYLPLTGITFYLAILISDARTMQIWVLVVFMSTYLTTSLLSMVNSIPQEEFDHARSLGCNRWEVLWEVVVKGRIDYVIDVIRQNLAIVWMMLVTVESILVAAGGLGFLIKNSDKFMNHGRIIALQIVILVVGLLIDFVLDYLRKGFFRYSKI